MPRRSPATARPNAPCPILLSGAKRSRRTCGLEFWRMGGKPCTIARCFDRNGPASSFLCRRPRAPPLPHPLRLLARQAPQALASHLSQTAPTYPDQQPLPPQTSQSRPPARIPITPVPPGGTTLDDIDFIATHRPLQTEEGLATWYTAAKGRKAANGQLFDDDAMTAAHRTLPMGSLIVVTNLKTRQSAAMRITDRGPFADSRIPRPLHHSRRQSHRPLSRRPRPDPPPGLPGAQTHRHRWPLVRPDRFILVRRFRHLPKEAAPPPLPHRQRHRVPRRKQLLGPHPPRGRRPRPG